MKLNRSRYTVRFGVFEVDLRAGELRRQGLKVKLYGRPFQVLALLLERPGEPVTREELRRTLWPADTFVDFDHGLNNAINKLRSALGDSAENPRFVETLPRHGYRFIGAVERVNGAASPPAALEKPTAKARPAVTSALVLAVVIAVGVFLGWLYLRPTSPVPRERMMLAVLPFENLSGDPEQEYFSDGMTEEMITRLGRLQPARLGVIARTSAMHYKGTDKRVDEIGQELGVDYILEGSVRREANRVRIAAQLIQVSDQSHLWAESYERQLEDIFTMQSGVAERVARSLQMELLPAQQARLASASSVDPEAYEAYLKGRHHRVRLPGGPQRSQEYFEQAITIDPTYAPAYAGLAEQYVFKLPSREHMPKARATALKALELDETLPEAHTAVALVKFFHEWDWLGAEKEFKKALELDPGSAEVHARYTSYLWAMGRLEEAIATAQRARELDPLSLIANTDLGRTYYFARQYNRAIEQYRKTLELDPNHYWARFFLAIAYQQKGMYEEANAEHVKARRMIGQQQFATALAEGYAASGYQGALKAWVEGFESAYRRGTAQPSSVAMLYSRLGEREKAFEWLEKGFEERTRGLVYLKVEPQFDPLRDDPRFQDLLRRMNFPE